jgi:hypothetical protein
MRIRNPGSGIFLTLDPGSGVRDGKIQIGIREKRPGSATLADNLATGKLLHVVMIIVLSK